ncbi:hypothetical protein Taro_017135 [Colocasia esculenta]|uniref:Uncharacterized protein n=1 Tax=Colocasia esculenta TaxID=4460 RepID=A0A843UQL8_COLES|nr:hypothetical protein [Colocasia esculenta]
MLKPQLGFPCCIKTPKTHGCLNTLHQTLGSSFTTCWGHVEEFLAAGELWNDHKKVIFFPYSSATTYATHPLRVEQRGRISSIWYRVAAGRRYPLKGVCATRCV